jgi:hypothetical protein
LEFVTLAAPEIVPQIVTTDYRIVAVHLLREPVAQILVTFRGTNGEPKEWRVADPVVAAARLKALNTANLSVKSLNTRIFELAIADGVFAGTVTGTPDV